MPRTVKPPPPLPVAPQPDEWVDIDEAMKRLGLTTEKEQRVFRRAVAKKEIKALRLSMRLVRINMTKLREKYA